MITYAVPQVTPHRLYPWLTVALLAAWFASQALDSFVLPTNQATRPLTSVDFGQLPLAFAPNAGQTDPSVLFTARAGGSAFYFTPAAVVISIAAPHPAALPPNG